MTTVFVCLRMLRSGKELKVFAVKDGDLQKFCQEAKKYGVLYCVLKDKNASDGITDIMVRAEDAAKVNRIFTRFGLATVDLASLKTELVKEQDKARTEEDADMQPGSDKPHNDDFVRELFGEDPEKHIVEENPQIGRAEAERPSESTSQSRCQKPRHPAAGRCPVKEVRMAEVQHLIQVNDYEQRLMVNGLNAFRNDLIRDGKPTEDINALLIKVIDAPEKKPKRKFDHER